MRRHWSQRLVAMLGAAWFVLIGIEPAVFGACPAHQSMGARSAHGEHGTAMPMDHGSAVEHQDTGAPADQTDHRCTCPGSCCGPSVAVVASVQTVCALSVRIAGSVRSSESQYRAA
ncbi:MAG: hypothetical protein V4550_20015 [Gemmatimonadota bacterium]